jgi:CheY-like chemotaxis protein
MVKILVIDDSAFQRKILTHLVNGFGYDIVTADNGQDGINQALLEKPDVILTDLLMPEYDGYWLLEQRSSQGIAIPVIIVTSDVQTTTMTRCLEMGAFGFLNKPVKAEELHSAIRKALAGVDK